MSVVAKLLRSSMLLAAINIGAVALTRPALADRPGTPNEVSIWNCPFNASVRPRLCSSFHNTATEEVWFEIEVTKNDTPISQKISCSDFGPGEGTCWSVRSKPGAGYIKSKRDLDDEKQGIHRPFVFDMVDLDFNAKYCVRFRARRVSDDMVSEIWSAGVCARTPGPPPLPGAPDFTIRFDGKQPVPNGPAIAETMSVMYNNKSASGAGHVTFVVRKANGPDSYDQKAGAQTIAEQPHGAVPNAIVYRISPDLPWLYVEGCASNISGQTCSHKVVSATAESVAANEPGGKPIASSKIGGTAAQRAFVTETNLPGMDYRSEPLRTNDPEVCQQLCNSETKCVAWTFVNAGVQSDRPMCWLKDNIPHPVRDPNTVSGIKAIEHHYLFHIDMPGKEYRQVAGSVWGDCDRVCSQDAQCKAWTWNSPGMQGPRAMCSLKNDVPAQVASENAVSGVKIGYAMPPPPAAQPNSAPPQASAQPNSAPAPQPPAPASAPPRPATQTNASPPPPMAPRAPPPAPPPSASPPPAAAQNVLLSGVDMPGKDYRNVVLNFSPTNRNNNQPVACQNLCSIEAQCKAWTWVKPGIQGPNAMCWLKNDIPARVNNPNVVSGLKVVSGAAR